MQEIDKPIDSLAVFMTLEAPLDYLDDGTIVYQWIQLMDSLSEHS